LDVATLRRCDVAALGIYTVLGMFRTSSEHYSLLAQLESVASLTSLLIDIYNFNEAGFLIGIITTTKVVTSSESRNCPKTT
jgi:hypothetical protein